MFKQHLAASHYRIHHQTLIESEPTGWIEYESVKKQIMEGEFKDDTLVLKKGGNAWLHVSEFAELKEILAVREALVSLKRKKKTKAWGERLKTMPKLVTGLFANFSRDKSSAESDSDSQMNPVRPSQPSDRSSEIVQERAPSQRAAPARAPAQTSKAGALYLVKLRYAGENYLKIGTRRNSAEVDVCKNGLCRVTKLPTRVSRQS